MKLLYCLIAFCFAIVSCVNSTNSDTENGLSEKIAFCNKGDLAFSNHTFFREVNITEVEPLEGCVLAFKDTLGIRLYISESSLDGKSMAAKITDLQLIIRAQGGANKFTPQNNEVWNGTDYQTYSGISESSDDKNDLFSKAFILTLDEKSPDELILLNFSFGFKGERAKSKKLETVNQFMDSFKYIKR